MRCDEVRERLVEYLEEELSGGEQAAVRAHVASCELCRSELGALERTVRLLRDDGYVEPEPFYWTRFEAGLRAKLRGRRRRFVLVPRLSGFGPRLAPVVAAVLLFAVGFGVGLQPLLNTTDAGQAPGAFAARPIDDRGPVISPRSKSLVEGGDPGRAIAQYAANAPDTLTPESFDSAMERPRMMLATDESWPEVERLLGEELLRD